MTRESLHETCDGFVSTSQTVHDAHSYSDINDLLRIMTISILRPKSDPPATRCVLAHYLDDAHTQALLYFF